MLKIFVGCEYECPRGHRFFMSSPDTILKGGSGNQFFFKNHEKHISMILICMLFAGIVKDGGSKIVFNDMPLYFPCPCRNAKTSIAQLMRVHVVTPKAPVNIILEPKVSHTSSFYYLNLNGFEAKAVLQIHCRFLVR